MNVSWVDPFMSNIKYSLARRSMCIINLMTPGNHVGIRDSSGFQFFFENSPRLHNAGILTIGHEVNRFMIVPPMATNYGITGVCSAQCTSQVSTVLCKSLDNPINILVKN